MFGTDVDSSAPTTIFPVSWLSCTPSLSRPRALVSGALPGKRGSGEDCVTAQERLSMWGRGGNAAVPGRLAGQYKPGGRGEEGAAPHPNSTTLQFPQSNSQNEVKWRHYRNLKYYNRFQTLLKHFAFEEKRFRFCCQHNYCSRDRQTVRIWSQCRETRTGSCHTTVRNGLDDRLSAASPSVFALRGSISFLILPLFCEGIWEKCFNQIQIKFPFEGFLFLLLLSKYNPLCKCNCSIVIV